MATIAAVSCENLNTLGVRRRRTIGLVAAGGALAWFAGLVAVRAPAIVFATMAFPAWAAALGLLQARARTCVRLAALGVRETEGAAPRTVEGEELVAIRARAGRISRRAMIVALVTAALAILLGGIARGITITR
ncbi:MAG: hypothetical protein ACYC3Q_02175 [Gemmatimonadaceae bacterium]